MENRRFSGIYCPCHIGSAARISPNLVIRAAYGAAYGAYRLGLIHFRINLHVFAQERH